MASETEYSRIITKVGNGIATIPPSADHSNGDWISTDIYEGELYLDESTGKLYTNLAGVITELNPTGLAANLSNTNLAQTDPTRVYDIDGGELIFDNGRVAIGTTPASNAQLTVSTIDPIGVLSTGNNIGVHGLSTVGMGGYFEGVNGLEAYSTGAGVAVRGESFSGLGGSFKGGVLVQPYGGAASPDPSALFEVNSTTKGILPSRMTTAQRDAISSPATGLLIWNITTGRFEHYNGSYWAGQKRILYVHHPSYNPSDSQTNFFSNIAIVPVTTTTAHEIVLRGSGVIRACDFNTWAATAIGTNEAFSLYIRINSTDYLVQTISAATQKRSFVNTSLNIPFVDGDVLRMNYVTPAWATNPTGLVGAGNIIIE